MRNVPDGPEGALQVRKDRAALEPACFHAAQSGGAEEEQMPAIPTQNT